MPFIYKKGMYTDRFNFLYSSPNVWIYLRCFLIAQRYICPLLTARKSHADQLPTNKANAVHDKDSKK